MRRGSIYVCEGPDQSATVGLDCLILSLYSTVTCRHVVVSDQTTNVQADLSLQCFPMQNSLFLTFLYIMLKFAMEEVYSFSLFWPYVCIQSFVLCLYTVDSRYLKIQETL